VIRLREAGFRYPGALADAVHDLDLDVGAGESVALVGDSGSGKTTVLRMLAGIAPAMTGGTAWGSGEIADRALPLRRGDLADRVGIVPQDPHAGVVAERVEDEIAFTAENLGIPSREIGARIEHLLDTFGIRALRRRRVATLSGGERQKVQLAAALVADPDVLLLDEPTSQLDRAGVDALASILGAMRWQRPGRSLLVVEHRVERLAASLDRAIEIGVPAAGAAPCVHAGPMRSPGDVVVAAEALTVALAGREVLRDVSVTLRRGEAVALVGENGSGKTTLLRALLRSVPLTSGRLSVQPPAGASAFVPQRPEVAFCRDRLRDEVALTMRARRVPGDVDAVLERSGLLELADRSPRHLSSGERLRAALCALTVGARDLILLDEPTRGLDVSARIALHDSIAAWRAEGIGVLLATHDDDLAGTCDRAIRLEAGRIAGDAASTSRTADEVRA
jgi:energy-coupling factor transport system ATP-binding protein